MEHLAIDLGGRESQMCVRSSDGQIVDERRCRTGALSAHFATRPQSRVVVVRCTSQVRRRSRAMTHESNRCRSSLVSINATLGRPVRMLTSL
jgi:hypothetical protein